MQVRYTEWAAGCAALVLSMCVACGKPTDTTHASTDAMAEAWTAPRTPWDEPDLQGVWRHQSATPLERLAGAGQFRTEEEVAAVQAAEEQRVALGILGAEASRPDPQVSPFQRNEYNRFWTFTGKAREVNRRTSLIVDPPNGRIPLTEEAAKIQQFHAEYVSNFLPEEHYNNSWRDRDTGERCLTDGTLGQMWGGTGPNQVHPRPRLRCDSARAIPRPPYHSDRWTCAKRGPGLAGQRQRPVGGRHAGRRNNQLPGQDERVVAEHL